MVPGSKDMLKRAVTPPGEPDEVVQELSNIATHTSLLGGVLGPGDTKADPRHTWGVLTLENLGVIDQLDGGNNGLVFPTKLHMTQSKTKTHWMESNLFDIKHPVYLLDIYCNNCYCSYLLFREWSAWVNM